MRPNGIIRRHRRFNHGPVVTPITGGSRCDDDHHQKKKKLFDTRTNPSVIKWNSNNTKKAKPNLSRDLAPSAALITFVISQPIGMPGKSL